MYVYIPGRAEATQAAVKAEMRVGAFILRGLVLVQFKRENPRLQFVFGVC